MTPLELLGDVTVLFAIISATLMIVSELLSPYYGKVGAWIDKRRIDQAAYAAAIAFVITMAIRILVALPIF